MFELYEIEEDFKEVEKNFIKTLNKGKMELREEIINLKTRACSVELELNKLRSEIRCKRKLFEKIDREIAMRTKLTLLPTKDKGRKIKTYKEEVELLTGLSIDQIKRIAEVLKEKGE